MITCTLLSFLNQVAFLVVMSRRSVNHTRSLEGSMHCAGKPSTVPTLTGTPPASPCARALFPAESDTNTAIIRQLTTLEFIDLLLFVCRRYLTKPELNLACQFAGAGGTQALKLSLPRKL